MGDEHGQYEQRKAEIIDRIVRIRIVLDLPFERYHKYNKHCGKIQRHRYRYVRQRIKARALRDRIKDRDGDHKHYREYQQAVKLRLLFSHVYLHGGAPLRIQVCQGAQAVRQNAFCSY